MSVVDKPIVNNPFEEPSRYYDFPEGQFVLTEGRRPAGYFVAPRSKGRRGPTAAEQLVLYDSQPSLSPVNEIRRKVREWRNAGYPGTTKITLELLRYWNNAERAGKHRLFFCEKEAAETIIWLVEGSGTTKQGIRIPKDTPTDQVSVEKGYGSLVRFCNKMATGSGKTVVMAMLIAWSSLNKVFYRRDRRFSDAFLVVCPNLTIKERLRVLYPSEQGNFYRQFDLVPASLIPLLSKMRIVVTNWHLFLPEDDSAKKSVVQRGEESDSAFCRRVLYELGEKENILVINDEAHHAYRLHSEKGLEEHSQTKISKEPITEVGEREEKSEAEAEATIWVDALDRVHKSRGINFCLDLSATPFYLKGSGHMEGAPFPWIVSDFGLVDAIESGIVKIPRVPVDDNSGQPIPKYFRLWQWIMAQLSSTDRATTTRRAKPEAVLRQAEGQSPPSLINGRRRWKTSSPTVIQYHRL